MNTRGRSRSRSDNIRPISCQIVHEEMGASYNLQMLGKEHHFIKSSFRLTCRYFRSGAPPVINPLHTRFPQDTIVPGSFAVTLTWTLPNRTTGVFNVTSPLPGDWFLAAHLPKDEGKISVKPGFSVSRQTL
nr:unnamed protein product [Salmo salar]|eukprot:XP_013999060.1 PREDICTED: transmembrane protein 8A-like [Salmo salar]